MLVLYQAINLEHTQSDNTDSQTSKLRSHRGQTTRCRTLLHKERQATHTNSAKYSIKPKE